MSLLAWQTALAELVTARAAGAHEAMQVGLDEALAAAECAWLDSIVASSGFKLTCDVQRWWREFRIQQAAPLTLGALNADRRAVLATEYIRRHGRPSSFFLREALPFLDLAAELASDLPYVPALAAFERAMLRLGDALADNPGLTQVPAFCTDTPIEAHPLAEVVCFEAPPEQVLAAASRGLPFPDAQAQSYWIVVAPGLRNFASGCTSAEAMLFQTIRTEVSCRRRVEMDPLLQTAFHRLWAAGALRHTG